MRVSRQMREGMRRDHDSTMTKAKRGRLISDLVIAALDMALFTTPPQGVIHHFD